MDDLSFGLAVRWSDSVKPKSAKTVKTPSSSSSSTMGGRGGGEAEKGNAKAMAGKIEFAAARSEVARKAK
jgi:hypothetical protein